MRAMQQRLNKEKDLALETFIDAARHDREVELNKLKEQHALALQDHLAEAVATKNAEVRRVEREEYRGDEERVKEKWGEGGGDSRRGRGRKVYM